MINEYDDGDDEEDVFSVWVDDNNGDNTDTVGVWADDGGDGCGCGCGDRGKLRNG